jgi:glucarate dehydratase
MKGMQIQNVETYVVSVPFKKPIKWALGVREGTTRILTKVTSDSGLTGWGETHYIHFVDGMIDRVLKPMLLGEDLRDFERLYAKIESVEFVNYQRSLNAAFCAVEMALWDLWGKALGLPVYRLLGGRFRMEIPIVGYLFIGDPEEQAELARKYVGRGFKTLKLKVGVNEEEDIAMMRRVREAVPQATKLRVDPNMAWTLGTSKRILNRIADCDLEYVEQPVRTDDFVGLSELRKSCLVPIAANEAAYTFFNIAELIRLRAVDVIVTDARTTGGLWKAKKTAAVCEAASLPMTIHSGGELGIGTAANLHWAASTPNAILALDCHYELQAEDVLSNPFPEGPILQVPDEPGLGVDVDPKRVEEFAKRKPYTGMGGVSVGLNVAPIPRY